MLEIVKNIPIKQHLNSSYNNKATKQQIAFKGGFIDTIAKIESTPVLGLLAIDLFGMIIPRIWIDTLRNKEELGHLNYDAGRETGIRESVTAFMLYFLPGLAAMGVGNSLLNNKYNKQGLNTGSFINFKTLNASKNQTDSIIDKALKEGKEFLSPEELRAKYVESMMGNITSRIDNTKQVSQEIKDELVKYIKDKTNFANIDKFMAENIPSDNVSGKSLHKIEHTLRKSRIKSVETYHNGGIIPKITEKIIHLFEDSKVQFKNVLNDKNTVIDAKTYVRDTITFADDIILKATSQTGINQNGQVNLNSLKRNLGTIFDKMENLKFAKTGLGMAIGMASLIAFPKINIWITKKLSHSEAFPGVRGLVDNKSDKKAGGTH